MATVTVSIDDDVEKRFREEVSQHLGTGKGTIGKAITEALRLWIEKVSQEKLSNELRKMMDSGYEMGKMNYKNRAELYDRK
ncbi:hypothetical protein KKF81_00190 [Candidatus Micrarchaeota archaeon]|nr:hypothetical protein [Candidatus Micrarchaeota archaeon]MBU1165336.1 hypothetical protein [Candidatus Micrarchaeota archaeon]MBU1886986.1 hypothetical protein [Candidatus Micrarchaeota archaeon]